MDKGDLANPKGGETTPNDDFWEYSAASKSVFLFDDDDDEGSWTLSESHFSKHEPSIKSGAKTSTNTSTTSSFESIQRFDDQLSLHDNNKYSAHTVTSKKVSHSNFLEPPPVSVTISNILRGEPYLLSVYRSKDAKISLLDSAIKSGDGNAILAAVFLLKNSLKASLFNQEIRKQPVAISHYIIFLKNHFDFNELYDFLIMLGRIEEAAMLKLKLAITQKNPEQKIVNLENCLKFHFMADPGLSFYSDMIRNQITLLQKQIAISKNDEQVRNQSVANQQKNPQASVLPPPVPLLIGLPVITSLYYCTLHHYSENETSFSSPVSLKKSYQLSDKQYTWTVISALAKKKDWNSIQAFLTTKGIFGGSKLRSCIGFEKTANILYKANAPPNEIIKYLKQVDSVEERLNIAKKFQCHTLVIDTYVQNKDAQSLLNYKSQLKQGTPEYSYIENALRVSTIKWKN